MSSSAVGWAVELSVAAECMARFVALSREMTAFARTEAGMLAYERHAADGGSVWVFERYRDAEAALAHLVVFRARFAARFGALVQRRRFLVFGDVTAPLAQALAEFQPTFLTALA